MKPDSSNIDPEQISKRARELWEQGGRQEGRDLDYWLEAERQLQTTPEPTAVTAGGSGTMSLAGAGATGGRAQRSSGRGKSSGRSALG
ncbi:MAG: DUF2934 domain-containing protein [Nibricoccus sp.]